MPIAHDINSGAVETAIGSMVSRPRHAVAVAESVTGSRAVALVGGLLTGLAVASVAWATLPTSSVQTLASIASSDIEVAAQSLIPASAAALIEQAKACRRPLGEVTVVASGSANGRVRFTSGSYRSPTIKLGIAPERLALPFPAPVEAGRGKIVVEGETDGVDVFLSPGVRIPPGGMVREIDVRWDPRSACR